MSVKRIGIDVSLTGAEQAASGLTHIGAAGQVAGTKVAQAFLLVQQQLGPIIAMTNAYADGSAAAGEHAGRLILKLKELGGMAGASEGQIRSLAAAEAVLTGATNTLATAQDRAVISANKLNAANALAQMRYDRNQVNLQNRSAVVEEASALRGVKAIEARIVAEEMYSVRVAKAQGVAMRAEEMRASAAERASARIVKAKEMEIVAAEMGARGIAKAQVIGAGMNVSQDATALKASESAIRSRGLAVTQATAMNAQFNAGLRDGTGAMIAHAEQTSLAERMIMRMVLAYAAYKTISGVAASVKDAAQYEMLGIAMRQVGMNAGYSGGQMATFQKQLEATGISMIGSRQSLMRMAAAQLDLNKAGDLARIAQDVARTQNLNSTETFEKMIQGIVSGRSQVLHTLNVMTNFAEAEKKWANEHGRQATEAEKLQIKLNAVLDEGAKRAGVYAAAFQTAGGQMLSATRYAEDMRTKVGTMFLPAITSAVFAYASALKGIGDNATWVASALTMISVAAIAVASAFLTARMASLAFGATPAGWAFTGVMAVLAITLGVITKKFGDAQIAAAKFAAELEQKPDKDLAAMAAQNEADRMALAIQIGKNPAQRQFHPSGDPLMGGTYTETGPAGVATSAQIARMKELMIVAGQINAIQKDRITAEGQLKDLQKKTTDAATAENDRLTEAQRLAQLKKDQSALDKRVANAKFSLPGDIENLRAETQAEREKAIAIEAGGAAKDAQRVKEAGDLARAKELAKFAEDKARVEATPGLQLNESEAVYKARADAMEKEARTLMEGVIAREHVTESVKALTKSQQDYKDVVLDPVAKLNAETDALNRLSLAKKQGKEETDAARIALAGELEVRKLLADLDSKKMALDPWMLVGAIGARQKAGEGKEAQVIVNEKIAKAAAEAKQTTDRLWRGVQEGLASAIENGFKKGIHSAQDFFDAMKGMLESVFSQWAAAKLTEKLKAAVTGTALSAIPAGAMGPNDKGATAGGGLGGLWGMVSAHPFIAAGVAVAGFAVSLLAAQDAAIEYKNQMMEAARAAKKSAEEWLHPSGEKDKMQADYMTAVTNTIMAFAAGVGDAYVTLMGYVRGSNPATGTAQPKDPALAAALKVLADEFARRVEQMSRYQNEDYTVRRMRAQGDTAGADRLAFDQAQARERQALIDSFGPFIDAMEQATLDNLNLTLSAEAAAYALNSLSTSALNAVSGYKYQAAIFGAATARPYGGGTTPGPTTVGGGSGGGYGGGGGAGGSDGVTVNATIVMPNGEVLTKVVLKGLKATAQRQVGDSSRWSEVQ